MNDSENLDIARKLKIDTLIHGGTVVTMDPARTIYSPGYVAIKGGLIVDVGPGFPVKFNAGKSLYAGEKVILPGFVNAHDHLVQTLYRGLGDRFVQSYWAQQTVFRVSTALTEERAFDGARLALIELAQSGVTTTADSHFPHVDPRSIDGVCQAIKESGLRGVVARSTMDRAPAPQRFWESAETALKETDRLQTHWSSDRITVIPEAINITRCSDTLIQEIYDYVVDRGTRWHMHLAGGQAEAEWCWSEHECGPAQWLDHLGVLDDRLLAAHCIWLNPWEIDLLAERGVRVAYNPVSNAYLGSGIAPIEAMVARGITVGLGVDGAASNNSQNMFETMKVALLLQKISALSATWGSAEDAIEMATLGSAQALGMDHRIGSLEPGKEADLFLLDIMQPHLAPRGTLISNLVFAGQASGVSTMLVGGEVVLDGGKLLAWNSDEVIHRSTQAQLSMLRETNSEFLLERSPWPIITNHASL